MCVCESIVCRPTTSTSTAILLLIHCSDAWYPTYSSRFWCDHMSFRSRRFLFIASSWRIQCYELHCRRSLMALCVGGVDHILFTNKSRQATGTVSGAHNRFSIYKSILLAHSSIVWQMWNNTFFLCCYYYIRWWIKEDRRNTLTFFSVTPEVYRRRSERFVCVRMRLLLLLLVFFFPGSCYNFTVPLAMTVTRRKEREEQIKKKKQMKIEE